MLRERGYRLLVDAPQRTWTVREFADACGSGPGASADAVRGLMYVLLADGVMEAVAGQRVLTARLTVPGGSALAAIVDGWSTRQLIARAG